MTKYKFDNKEIQEEYEKFLEERLSSYPRSVLLCDKDRQEVLEKIEELSLVGIERGRLVFKQLFLSITNPIINFINKIIR